MIHPFWNRRERRLRALWRLLAQLLLMALLVLACTPLLSPLTGSVMAIWLGSLLGVGTSVWLAGRWFDRRPFLDFGLHLGPAWWLDFAFGLVLGFVLMAGVFLTEYAAGWVHVTGTFQTTDPEQPFLAALAAPLVAFLCIGIYEELLSRGYQLTNLAEGLNLPQLGPRAALILAWLLSSGLFGLAHAFNPHASLISTVNVSLAGLFLGLGYILTGELALPIGLHITWNFAQGSIFGFPVSGTRSLAAAQVIAIEQQGPDAWTGGAFGPEGGLIGLAAMLVGTLLTLAWVRARHGHVHLHRAIAAPPDPAPSETRSEV